MSKTNSNSMTVILINSLNNKKSGFRNAFFRLLDEKECNNSNKLSNCNLNLEEIVFEDGTHSSIGSLYPEMGNKEVDIVAKIKNKVLLLIEIKVSLNEDLQESQAINGEYQQTLEAHKEIKRLVYIIPDGYYHEFTENNEPYIPVCKGTTKIYWTEILSLAESYDSSGIENHIKNLVELPTPKGEITLTKGESCMLMELSLIKNAYRLSSKIKEMSRQFANLNKLYSKEQDNIQGVGNYISINDEEDNSNLIFWIGVNPSIENDYYLFSIGFYNKDIKIESDEGENWEPPKNPYPTEDDYWTYLKVEQREIEKFLLSEDSKQQHAFNIMIIERLQKIKFTEDKYNDFVGRLIS